MNHTVVNGDILDYINNYSSQTQDKTLIVMHQANCFNTLHNARGIAGVLGKAYPEIAIADDTTSKGDEGKLGTYTYVTIGLNLKIFNVYGQYGYGNGKLRNIVYTQEDYLIQGLQAARDMALSLGTCKFLIPLYIGAGLANGNHESIKQRMDEIFKDEDVIYIYN